MHPTDDLFADHGADFVPVPDRLEVVAGKVVATLNKPSAAHKRFNALMAKVDAGQVLSKKLRHAAESHGSAHQHALHVLTEESALLCAQMVVFLDERIQAPGRPKDLTPNQKQQAVRMVLGLCEQLPEGLDPAVDAIRERYAPPDVPDDGEPHALVQDMLESFLGEDFTQGRRFESSEELLGAAMAHAREREQKAQEKRAARRAARRAQKGPSAREVAAEQKALDAQGALRTVYRQLVSSLHPDRETDQALRERKTALMSEVNAAYERQELSTLLRIQLESEMVDAAKATALTEARLKSLCDLLSEQVKALDADNWQLRVRMEFELGYPAHWPYDEARLLSHLEEERTLVQDDIEHMRADLRRVQDDRSLKAWLKEQLAAQKSRLRAEQAGLDDDFLAALLRRRGS